MENTQNKARFVIITGLSGSGKTTALHAFEDLGFYAIDNLPVGLLPAFVEMSTVMQAEIFKAAIVMDLRTPDFVQEFPRIYNELIVKGYNLEILFLDTQDDILIRRFSLTRRNHPLGKSISQATAKERELLNPIRNLANQIIDTGGFNVHELKKEIESQFDTFTPSNRMQINFISFGFKYGLPLEADIVQDVRFLVNPYFIEELRPLDGRDHQVVSYIIKHSVAIDFLSRLKKFLEYLIPMYLREGKAQLTIAIGCTGGKHRSVAVANWLAEQFYATGCRIRVRHRDVDLGDK